MTISLSIYFLQALTLAQEQFGNLILTYFYLFANFFLGIYDLILLLLYLFAVNLLFFQHLHLTFHLFHSFLVFIFQGIYSV